MSRLIDVIFQNALIAVATGALVWLAVTYSGSDQAKAETNLIPGIPDWAAECPMPMVGFSRYSEHLRLIIPKLYAGCHARYPQSPCLGAFIAVLKPDGSWAYQVQCSPKLEQDHADDGANHSGEDS